jgi:hypothetical protein
MERRSFKINPIVINRKSIEEVIIDTHVDKHSDHISDELIIELISELFTQSMFLRGLKIIFNILSLKFLMTINCIKWFGF